MKQVTTLLLLIILSATTFSQQNDPSPTLTKQAYIGKSRKQKTTAWILLGSSVAIFSATYIAQSELFLISPIICGPFLIASVHFFNVSAKNKSKALNMSFNMQQIPQLLQPGKIISQSIPSINLKISL